MATKNPVETGGFSSALETVCGWAVCAGVSYALLFLNLTGDGSLWNSLVGTVQNALPAASEQVATRTYVIPAKPVDRETREQDRMLMIPENDTAALAVTVQDPSRRSYAALTDAPRDMTGRGSKDWRVHLKGELPAVAVSGPAEQSSTAIARAGSPYAAVATARTSTSITGSSYRAPAVDGEATPRPGIEEHAPAVRAEGSDGLRNFMGASR